MQVSEEFSLSVVRGTSETLITCVGVLDVMPSHKLRAAIGSVLNNGASALVLDCSNVTLITSAGITALVDAAIRCQAQELPLEFILSQHVRRILDRVGLWWLGIIDDGISAHVALQGALKSYADQSFNRTLLATDDADRKRVDGDPDSEER